ncbi:hypothetical protein NP493_801g00007 [Ridgeia piscesae]|uniref:Solute carrier family 3 member 2 N-terminal domain-containing protein n=1 Tax=Ridgeia piscesae TaxID=27915 RepID=A0AAD9KNH7_RIDPI|nr:hypothetical protein NP493_801g00007 [Ridgeia piscesae]
MTRYPPQIASNTSRPTAVEYAENIRGLSGQGDAYEILNAFSPLTKKELMKFAEDPHWVKQRKVFLVGAWLFWSAITGFSGLILVFSKRCEASPDTTWLQEANIYHIFPRSFVDSDRDGIGDIKGVQMLYKTANKTANKTVYKTVNKAEYMTAYKTVYKTVTKTANKTVYKPVYKTLYKTVNKTVYKMVN